MDRIHIIDEGDELGARAGWTLSGDSLARQEILRTAGGQQQEQGVVEVECRGDVILKIHMEAKRVAIERLCTVQVRDKQHRGIESFQLHSHGRVLPPQIRSRSVSRRSTDSGEAVPLALKRYQANLTPVPGV